MIFKLPTPKGYAFGVGDDLTATFTTLMAVPLLPSADLNNWINYLVTPLGTVRKYDPADGSDIIIYFDVPYDSNHPGRK